jgi:hypothetical protein
VRNWIMDRSDRNKKDMKRLRRHGSVQKGASVATPTKVDSGL